IWESAQPYFAPGTASLAVAYGPFGETAYQALPRAAQWAVAVLPDIVRPLASVTGLVVTRFIGLYYGLAMLVLLIKWAGRQWRLEWAEVYMLAVIGCTIVAASLFVLKAWESSDGNWGLQALFAVPALASLLAVRPMAQLASQLVRQLGPA